jgi:uncharacterized protein (TIGR03083 family)
MDMGELYRDGRRSLVEIGRSLTDEDAAKRVPACPQWTVKDVYAHLAGVTDDAMAGRLEGAPGDAWTARQVEARKRKSLTEILDEWETTAPAFEEFLSANGSIPQLLIDQWTHEQDIRAALDRPGNRDDARAKFSIEAITGLRKSWRHTPMEIIGDSGTWRWGDGDPQLTLRASDYDLVRVFIGRRSRNQVRAMDWTGDPEPVLDHLVAFEYSAEDQPA